MTKESCNCFTCRHKDEPRVVAGYLQGYIEASDWFINWAEKNKIKMGSIADNDLGGIYAQMKCNRDESGRLLEDFPDLERPIENLEAENERLKKQLKDYEKTLKDYANGYNYAYVDNSFAFYSNNYSNEGLAQEVLKKWEVE